MIRILIMAAVLLAGARPSFALCGMDGQGPCYRFWKVDAVFVGKILEKIALPVPGDDPPPGTIRLAENYRLQVRVVEAFRGVESGAVMTLFAPDGVCGGVNAEDGGEMFVYGLRNKAGEMWAQGCGVSKPLEDAAADLAYARSVSDVGPSALIYGDVVQREDRTGGPEDFSEMGGAKVRVHGSNFEAETITDQDGNYSMNLPGAGVYTVEMIPPRGFADRLGNGSVRIEIVDRRSCYRVPFQLRRDGRLHGRVIDREGQPIANLMVRAGNLQGFSKTDESGRFEIGPLGKGLYRLAAQIGGARELKFENSELVEVETGKTTQLSPLVAVATNLLVLLAVDVKGPGEGEALVLVKSRAGGELGGPVPAGSGPVRFLVEKDQSFEIVAATMTHSATTTVRSSSPVTEITLTLRPSPQQQ